jgi:hypothetical protein
VAFGTDGSGDVPLNIEIRLVAGYPVVFNYVGNLTSILLEGAAWLIMDM